MDNDKKSIQQLVENFEKAWRSTRLPQLNTLDLLDVMDYYLRQGKDFEADLCRHIAQRQDPENTEVVIMNAHSCTDSGDWSQASAICRRANISEPDKLLFSIEHSIRCGFVDAAQLAVLKACSTRRETVDLDLIYDAALLFRDYGYMSIALSFLRIIPESYIDYAQTQSQVAEILMLEGRFDEAREHLNRMIDEDPYNQESWERLATISLRQEKYGEAVEDSEYAAAIGASADADFIKKAVTIQTGDAQSSSVYKSAQLEQDYRLCLEYASAMERAGRYDEAVSGYSEANLYCPMGNRDRGLILSRLAICRIKLDAPSAAMAHLEALPYHQSDVWSDYQEAAGLLFERNRADFALRLLRRAHTFRMIYHGRFAQLAAVLAMNGIFSQATDLWKAVKENEAFLPQVYLQYLEKAQMEIGSNL